MQIHHLTYTYFPHVGTHKNEPCLCKHSCLLQRASRRNAACKEDTKVVQKNYSVCTCQEYHAYNKLARLDTCLYSHECAQVHKHSHTSPGCQAYLSEAVSALKQPYLCICLVQKGCIYVMCSLIVHGGDAYTSCASVNGNQRDNTDKKCTSYHIIKIS